MFTKDFDHFESDLFKACGFTEPKHFHDLFNAVMQIYEECDKFSEFVQRLENLSIGDAEVPERTRKMFRAILLMTAPLMRKEGGVQVIEISAESREEMKEIREMIENDIDSIVEKIKEEIKSGKGEE